ncbi:MAG: FG-GAP-like repeat-containing protein [Dongiaceae bacterium]
MSLTINSNLAASISTRTVQQTDRAMSDSLAKLASGQRVPNARYDTAALSISGRIRGQIVSLQAAVTNVTQASSLLQTVDATYQRVQDMLYRMRDLSTQAQGSQLSTVERGMLNTEFQQLKTEITRLANGTTFGATALFAVGNMNFSSSTNYSLGASPSSFQVADFTGDGFADIVTMDSNDDLLIRQGDGNGGFGPASSISVLLATSLIAAGDFNGDGRTDIFTGGSLAGVFLSNGNGTFTSGGSMAIGGISSLNVADLNGDGFQDVVTTIGIGGFVNVYLGNGNGTFASVLSSTPVTVAGQTVLGDVNNDGIIDAIVYDSANTRVQTLIGNGNGTFTTGAVSANFGANLSTPQLVDFNNDGFLDYYVGDSNGISSSYLLINNGQGGWNTPQTIAIGTINGNAYAADFNADGNVDIISTGGAGQTFSYRQGTGIITFASAVTSAAQGATIGQARYADINNDGRLDVILGAGSNLRVILNQAVVGLEGSVRVGSGAGNGNDIALRSFGITLNNLSQGLAFSVITQIGSAKRATTNVIAAIDQLLRYRANIGALLNRLEKVGQNLDTLLENNELARSSLMDVDAAEEMSKFISLQILRDAGISMLAQSKVTQQNLVLLFQYAPKFQ